MVAFKTKVLHVKIESTPIKGTNGKRKFLFVDKRKLLAMKLSFEEFNLVFFTADQSACHKFCVFFSHLLHEAGA